MAAPRLMTRSAAGALLALLAVGLAAPGARAGCIFPHQATGGGPAHLDHLAMAGALSGIDEDPAGPARPLSPCAGLRCSGDPAPSAPSVPVASPRAEHWGCLAAPVVATDPTAIPLPVSEPSARPSHRGPAPFHPPR